MANRSVVVVLMNLTDRSLTLVDTDLSHGKWDSFPPASIGPQSQVTWETQSDGFATGTEGRVGYHVSPINLILPPVQLHWDNPFAGSNSYDESAPPGYWVIHDGGGGDDATVTFFLTPTIGNKYVELGGPLGFLGEGTTAETTAPDGIGHFRHYQGGSIYWTPRIGAHEVHGAIRDKWASLGFERSSLGYPISDESPAPDGQGRESRFEHGFILWTPTTGAIVG